MEPPVVIPAAELVSPVVLPTIESNLFEFIFSQPFVKGSQHLNASPASIRNHALPAPIPSFYPIFTDGNTSSVLSFGKLKADALAVAGSLRHGPLKLEPAPLSVSNALINRGSVVSPTVLIHLPNCLPFVSIAYGVIASGLTLTAANPALTPAELAHILSLSKPVVIITSTAGLPTIQDAVKLLPPASQAAYASAGNVFTVDLDHDYYAASASAFDRPAERTVGGWRVQDWQALLPAQPIEFTPPRYSGSESSLRTAVIFWSSGTSGKSKGVMMSHAALASSVIAAWHNGGLAPGERLVGLPPMYHIFGWSNVFQLGPASGASVALVAKFDPVAYLGLVQSVRATHLHIAPPVAVLLAKSPLVSGFDLSSVKACTSGGAPLGTSVISAVHKRLGVLVRMGYGLSETCGSTEQKGDTWAELEKRLGTSGIAFPGTDLRIASVDDVSKTVGVDEPGEILIKCGSLMSSYLDNEVATAEAFTDKGEFRTGDVGKIDANKNLWIVDRLKEIIKVKGFQVAPADLEDGLCSSPLVLDAGVSSIYHEEHATEYPRAWVVPADKSVLAGGPKAKEFAKAVAKHIEGKFVNYKWVRGGFVIVEAIPKSPSGKILRRTLKDTKGVEVQPYEEKVRAKL